MADRFLANGAFNPMWVSMPDDPYLTVSWEPGTPGDGEFCWAPNSENHPTCFKYHGRGVAELSQLNAIKKNAPGHRYVTVVASDITRDAVTGEVLPDWQRHIALMFLRVFQSWSRPEPLPAFEAFKFEVRCDG